MGADPSADRRPLPRQHGGQKHRLTQSSSSPHSTGSNKKRRPQMGGTKPNTTRGGHRWMKNDEGKSRQEAKSSSSPAMAAAPKVRKTTTTAKNKPKHLKRKLAALEDGTTGTSADAASDDRRRLQQQLEQWESGKRAYQERKRQRREEEAAALSSTQASFQDRSAANDKRPAPWQSPLAKGKNGTRAPVQRERGSSRRPNGTSDVSSTLMSTAQRFTRGQPSAADARPSHHPPANAPSLAPAAARGPVATRGPSRDAPEARHENAVVDAGEHHRDGDAKAPAPQPERAKRRRGRKAGEEEATSSSLKTSIVSPSATTGSSREATDARKDPTSENDDHGADDNDSDGETQPLAMKRERGKRRRGRKGQGESDGVPPTLQATQEDKSIVTGSAAAATPPEGAANDEARPSNGPSKLNATDGTNARYCVGRKPVTDFAVGQSYDGTVVYAKPFGVFLDIGCHSDAFCHVSRLSDDFVDDPEARFRPGDAVVAARVVEIDRPRKRITVSLQSAARMADEVASMDAKRERRKRQHPPPPQPKPQPTRQRNGKAEVRSDIASTAPALPDPKKPTRPLPPPPLASHPTNASSSSPGPVHNPTPQELKRARKLERRAARRADAGVEGGATTQ